MNDFKVGQKVQCICYRCKKNQNIFKGIIMESSPASPFIAVKFDIGIIKRRKEELTLIKEQNHPNTNIFK